MRVRIELELDEECIDEDSPTGMTEAAYERLADELNGYGFRHRNRSRRVSVAG